MPMRLSVIDVHEVCEVQLQSFEVSERIHTTMVSVSELLLVLLWAVGTCGFHRPSAWGRGERTRLGSSKRSGRADQKQKAVTKFKNMEEMLDSFQEEPVLLAFTAVNCGPCRLQKQELAAFRESVNLKILAIDMEKWPRVGSRFAVGKLPCVVIIQGKEVKLRLEGLTSASELVRQVRECLFIPER
jgi:thiol-disulfide isomerase/thioredoxin